MFVKPSSLLLAFFLFNISTVSTRAQGTATITGRVTLAGQAVAGVEVLAQAAKADQWSFDSPPFSATTDADGRYRLTSLSAGSYRLKAHAPAYVADPQDTQHPYGRLIEIREGESRENLDFALTRGAVITGRVTDSSGRGLIEEPVTIYPVDASGKAVKNDLLRIGRGSTDDRGQYRIFGLSPGRYRIAAGAEPNDPRAAMMLGNRYQRTWHPETVDEKAAKIVEVGAGEEIDKIDIAMVPGEKKAVYSAAGRIFEAETGAPVSGAMVLLRALKEGQGGPMVNQTTSNSRGEFLLESIPAGPYEASTMIIQGSELYGEPVRFEVAGGDVTGLEIRMIQGGSIGGTFVVEGEAPPEVLAGLFKIMVIAQNRSGKGPMIIPPARNTAQGFRLGGLPPGKIGIMVQTSLVARELVLARIEYQGAEVRDFDLQPGEYLIGVRIVLRYNPSRKENRQ